MKTGARTSKQLAGQQAEQLALHFLERRGMTLVMRNYLCKAGELDLIMRQDSLLIFVEVRKRSNPRFGGAIESVTPQKQQRLIRAAQHYLLCHPQWRNAPCRFDVILFAGSNNTPEWIQNAFQA